MNQEKTYDTDSREQTQDKQGVDEAVSRRRPRVIVGMSGGVDSSVTAALLMQAGYDVVGVTCVFTDSPSSQSAIDDAQAVAKVLGIQHLVYDCQDIFEQRVVQPFVDGYACGCTPSPCVGCNACVKIPALIVVADELALRDGQPCDFVATGHYARVVQRGERFSVACAADAAKDQSYMLSLLTQEQLSRLVLPLGEIAGGKPEVRRIAAELGLPTASKSESQDICFIPDGNHQAFLERRGIVGEPGDIVTRDGALAGRHEGLFRYTIGQRKGLGIGGAPRPYYVVEKDAQHNRIVVAFENESFIDCVQVADLNWQAISSEDMLQRCAADNVLACSVKLRYRQKAVPCRLVPGVYKEGSAEALDVKACTMQPIGEDLAGGITSVSVVLESPQTPTAPGQFAVFYDGDVVLGAGIIKSVSRLARN